MGMYGVALCPGLSPRNGRGWRKWGVGWSSRKGATGHGAKGGLAEAPAESRRQRAWVAPPQPAPDRGRTGQGVAWRLGNDGEYSLAWEVGLAGNAESNQSLEESTIKGQPQSNHRQPRTHNHTTTQPQTTKTTHNHTTTYHNPEWLAIPTAPVGAAPLPRP